jgi:hypothetical protein
MRLVATVLALGLATDAVARDHVASREQVDAALLAARAAHERGLTRIQVVLDSPAAKDAASRLGVDLATARRSLAALDDAELADLVRRAGALDQDPVAGQQTAAPHAPSNPIKFLAVIAILFLVAFSLVWLNGGFGT